MVDCSRLLSDTYYFGFRFQLAFLMYVYLLYSGTIACLLMFHIPVDKHLLINNPGDILLELSFSVQLTHKSSKPMPKVISFTVLISLSGNTDCVL